MRALTSMITTGDARPASKRHNSHTKISHCGTDTPSHATTTTAASPKETTAAAHSTTRRRSDSEADSSSPHPSQRDSAKLNHGSATEGAPSSPSIVAGSYSHRLSMTVLEPNRPTTSSTQRRSQHDGTNSLNGTFNGTATARVLNHDGGQLRSESKSKTIVDDRYTNVSASSDEGVDNAASQQPLSRQMVRQQTHQVCSYYADTTLRSRQTTAVTASRDRSDLVIFKDETMSEYSDHEEANAPDVRVRVEGGLPSCAATTTQMIGDGVTDLVSVGGPLPVQQTIFPYREVEGDDPVVNTPATRYTFETSTMSWTSKDVFLRVLHPQRGYDQDDLHVYFAVEQVVNARTSIPMAVKMLRNFIENVREDDYFGEGQCQAIAETYARQFNRLRPRPGVELPTLPLLTCRTIVRIDESAIPMEYLYSKSGFYSYRTRDTGAVLFMMEPNTVECVRQGISFSSDLHMTSYPPSTLSKPALLELANAFSHFTYTNSVGQLVVSGLQRYAGYLVDPLVHTEVRKGYGRTNNGHPEVAKWRDKHRCNPICRAIALRPLEGTVPQPTERELVSNYYLCLSQYITDYVDACVPDKEAAWGQRAQEPPKKIVIEPFVSRPVGSPTTAVAEKVAPALMPAKKNVHVDVVSPAVVPPPPALKSMAAADVMLEVVVPQVTRLRGGSVTLTGHKYVFQRESQRWFPSEINVVVPDPDQPLTRDRRSAVFAAEEIITGDVTVSRYARVLTGERVSDVDYYNIMDICVLCSTLAAAFNNLKREQVFKKFVHFMKRVVVRVRASDIADENLKRPFFVHLSRDSRDLVFLLEPVNVKDTFARLAEDYKSQSEHNTSSYVDSDDDYGYADSPKKRQARDKDAKANAAPSANVDIEWQQVLETFYHYSYLRTNRYVVLRDAKFAVDIAKDTGGDVDEVTEGSLVDPRISTFDGRGFDGINEGNSSVQQWVMGHRCNALCGLLGLPASKAAGAIMPGPASKRDPYRLATLPRQVGMHHIYPAAKFEFNFDTLTWMPSKVYIRVVNPDQGYAMGAMRVVFEVAEVSSGAAQYEKPALAKMFRHNILDVVERDYFNEGALQNLCVRFGKLFQETAGACVALEPRGDTTQLEFLPISIVCMARETLPDELFTKKQGFFSYKAKDTQRILFTMEEALSGRFTKYNNNAAGVFVTSETKLTPQQARRRTHIVEAAEALSHFSLTESDGALLVCDVQGVDVKLTDPEIHTHDGQGFGIGNRGRDGMMDFVGRHRCNFVCKSMQLPMFNTRVPQMRNPDTNEWARKLTELNNMPISAALVEAAPNTNDSGVFAAQSKHAKR